LTADRTTSTARTAARNQMTTSPGYALNGADGVQFGTVAGKTYPAMPATACAANNVLPNTCWTTTAAANFSTTTTNATYEYEVCFKCHSSFAFGSTTYPTASSTYASGTTSTDVAADFSPTNKSGHPVITGLNSYTGTLSAGTRALNATQLLAPWNVNVGTQTMLCTDCHSTDATSTTAVQGPHGSAVRFFLAGANKAWPYTVAGANSGTLFKISTAETGIGTNNGLFCRNCHPPMGSGTATNGLHINSNLTGGQHGGNATIPACVSCHIRVPHGGKVSRLIVTTNAPTRYKVGTPNMTRFAKSATYSTYSASANVGSSCGQHSSGGATNSESW
jgi:hypothetical protein